MNKPSKYQLRPLSSFTTGLLAQTFARQGFASSEIVTRWPDIVGAEIATHSQPIKMQWPRAADGQAQEPATLVLRVEGPLAIEIQHLSGVIIDRVNRFFGWQAVGRIALRQAPLTRRRPRVVTPPGVEETALVAAGLPAIEDEDLKQALARLGAAIKRK